MPKTTYTVDVDLNKNAPSIPTRIDFTTYYNKPRMLMQIDKHIIEVDITKELIKQLQEIIGENHTMPNWTNNTIIGKKDVLQKYIDEDEDYFDFNRLIPMPEALEVESGSNSYDALIALAIAQPDDYDDINGAWKKLNMFNKALKNEDRYKEALANPDFKNNKDFEDQCAFGRILLDNYKNYGACDWYEWRVSNWGTKWNASNCYVDEYGDDLISIKFDTAWAPPMPIFQKLCDRYPDENFLFEWQNEDGFETHYFAMAHDGEIYDIDEKYEDDDSFEVVNWDEIDAFRDEMLAKAGL